MQWLKQLRKHRSTHTHTLLLKIAKCNVCSSAMSSIILAPQTLQRSLSTSERSLPNMEKGHLLLATCGVNMLYVSSNSRDSVVKMAPGDSLLCTKARFFTPKYCFYWYRFKWEDSTWNPPPPSYICQIFRPPQEYFYSVTFLIKFKGKFSFFRCPYFPPVSPLNSRWARVCARAHVCVCLGSFLAPIRAPNDQFT